MRVLTVVLIAFVSIGNLCAQELGINASIFNAKGEFNNNLNNNPAGISINYLHNIGQRFRLGGEIGVAMYSNKTYKLDSGPYAGTEIHEEDCFWTMHVMGQYALHKSPMLDVYVEGRLGMTTFFSSKDPVDPLSGYEGEFKFHGTAFNSGIGGGAKVNLSGLFKGDGAVYNRLWLDAAVTANSGSKTQYRSASEGDTNLEQASYETFTNYVHYRIGLKFNFGKNNSVASE